VGGGGKLYHTNQYTVLLITCMDHRSDQQPALSIYPITKLAAATLVKWNRVLLLETCRDIRARQIYAEIALLPCLHKHHFICLWLYSLCGPWPLFNFLILITVGKALWTGDQLVARPLPTHKINADTHPCLEWDSNP
jgi:hypothetical protein